MVTGTLSDATLSSFGLHGQSVYSRRVTASWTWDLRRPG